MVFFNFLTIVAVLAVVWHVITTLRIYDFLQKRNIPVNFILLRLFTFRYVSQYKQITRQEKGKVGKLFYHWIISINITLIAVIIIFISYYR